MHFRKDINGLRAIAVMSVVLYHFGIRGATGGFVGVDIFFVISGFLMTRIIVDQYENGKFKLRKFLLDRCVRILPALIVLCLILLAFGWVQLIPIDYQLLGKHIAASLGFISNVIYWQESGFYGDLASQEKWLLHTWSLSLEWQFYILFPIAILVIRHFFSFGMLRVVIILSAITSLMLSVLFSEKFPSPSFYLLPTRAWELLAGSLVFLFPLKVSDVGRKLSSLTGWLLLFFSIVLMGSTHGWPSYQALLPVCGTMLILMSAQEDNLFVSAGISQWIGSASYSIYLWHWPIVVGLNYKGLMNNSAFVIVAIILSIILGYLSYSLVESPSRKFYRNWGAAINIKLASLVCITSVVVLLGYQIFLLQGVEGNIRTINSDERAVYIQKYRDLKNNMDKVYRLECDFLDHVNGGKKEIADYCSKKTKTGGVFLWGDSHAQHLVHGLISHSIDLESFSQITTSDCRPSTGAQIHKVSKNDTCDSSNSFALAEIERLKPRLVILAQKENHLATDWLILAERLNQLGVQNVVLIGPAPKWQPALPLIITRRHWKEKFDYINDGLVTLVLDADKKLARKYGASNKLIYLSLIDLLCQDSKCLASIPGGTALMAVDYGHFSAEGSLYAVGKLLNKYPALLPGYQ